MAEAVRKLTRLKTERAVQLMSKNLDFSSLCVATLRFFRFQFLFHVVTTLC